MTLPKTFLTVSLLTGRLLLHAQAPTASPYPPPPTALQPITAIEWFIDKDPGFGNGHALPASSATNIADLAGTISLTGIPKGVHRLFVRSRDADGSWSLTAASTFENFKPAYTPPPSVVQPITAIEWFIDKDPGFGNGHPLPASGAIDIADLAGTISLTGIPNGVHRLFVRSRDLNGSWSLTAAGTFENFHPAYPSSATALTPISQVEVFFDNDPGIGKGSLQSLPAGTDISNQTITLNIDTLPKGPHVLFVRTHGIQSLSASAPISNDGPLPLTWLYFKAEDINGQSQLTWATAEESNTLKFEIEYSEDGNTFTTVGSTPAAGNSSTVSTYKWIHSDPAPGTNYYRIKQIDLDKHYTWSKVVTLFYVSGLGKTTVLPNPVIDRMTILLATPADQSVLSLYNAAGQSLLKVKLQDGTQQQAVDLSAVPAGIYFMEIQHKGSRKELLRILKK